MGRGAGLPGEIAGSQR